MNTSAPYRLMGRPESGYSLKVRSALRYKHVNHEWMDRFRHSKLFQQHAKVQLIPLLFLPDGSSMQDSTPILERLEADHPEPALHPDDPALKFLSILMEEYGDEWANKLMFHYRWGYPADQKRRGASLARGMIKGIGLGWLAPILTPPAASLIIRRMVPRMAFAGANDNNAPLLIESFRNLADMLQAHLTSRKYLFGNRPAFGDFGLWGQLYQAYIDASCEQILEQRAPAAVAWIKRMESPAVEGDFEALESLSPTLLPIFSQEIGPRFLAWSDANAKAWAEKKPTTELTIDGQAYYQKTFKYPAGSLDTLKEHYCQAKDCEPLNRFLNDSGCLAYLRD